MIAKKADLAALREEFRKKMRLNSAPGVLISRTTRGNFSKPVAKARGAGGTGFVPKWG